jgi:hypothetical protein
MRQIPILIVCFLMVTLAACGGEKDTSLPPTATAAPTVSPVLVHLQRDYELLHTSHEAISNIWESLAANNQVQCGDYPTVIPTEGISAQDDPAFEALADHLRRAAIGLNQALDLWKSECANPRATIPPDVINEGRLAARAAGDALAEAQTLLSDIQP